MKRIVSTLALAAPLATVALSLGATPAMAEPAGPESLSLPIAPDPEPGPGIDDEKAPLPEDPERPDGPGEIKDKDPCPLHGPCGDGPGDEEIPGDEGEKDPDEPGDDFKKPNRIDAGTGSTDGGMELAWLMAGGGLITATGAAYAVRSRVRARA